VNGRRHKKSKRTTCQAGHIQIWKIGRHGRIVVVPRPSRCARPIPISVCVMLAMKTRWQLRRATRVDNELIQIYGFYEGQNRGVGTALPHQAGPSEFTPELAHPHCEAGHGATRKGPPTEAPSAPSRRRAQIAIVQLVEQPHQIIQLNGLDLVVRCSQFLRLGDILKQRGTRQHNHR